MSAVLVRGTTTAFFGKIFILGVSFCSQILLTQLMGVEQYGVYIYVMSWIGILTIPAKMGLDTGAIKLVSQLRTQENWSLLKGFLRRSVYLSGSGAIVVGAIVIVVIFLFRSRMSPNLFWTFLIATFLLPVYVLLLVQEGILRGLKKITLSQIPSIVQSLLLMIAVGTLYGLNSLPKLESTIIMLLQVLTTFTAFILAVRLIHKSVVNEIVDVHPIYETAVWLRISLPMMIMSAIFLILSRIDIIMLGFLVSPEQAGIYAVASRVAGLMTFCLSSVSVIAAPMISEMYSKNKLRELQQLIRQAGRIITLSTLLLLLLILFLSKFILSLFGSEFIEGQAVLFILAGGQFFSALAGPVGLLLTMTGHQKDVVIYLGISAFLNFSLNLTLIPYFGAEGTAMSTAITTILWNVLLTWRVYKLLGIKAMLISSLQLQF